MEWLEPSNIQTGSIVKWINVFDYLKLIKRRKKHYLLHENCMVFASHTPGNTLCHVLLKLKKWFLIRFFSFSLYAFAFSLFCNYLSLEKSRNLHLNKLESSSANDALWLVWLKLVQRFLRRILNFLNACLLFCGPIIWTNLNPLHQSQLWLNLSQRFWRTQKCLRQQRQRRQ